MEKNDIRSLGIALILNIFIIFSIPGMPSRVVDTAKISVGFIELKDENKKVTPKKTEQESVEKTIPQVKSVEKESVDPVKKKKIEPVKIENPDFEINSLLAVDKSLVERTVVTKKDILNNKAAPRVETSEKLEVTEGELKGQEKLQEIDQKKIKGNISEIDIPGNLQVNEKMKENGFKSIATGSDDIEELPDGIKVGSEDGEIVPGWDDSNTLPDYPTSTLEKGLFGKVKFKLDIEMDGEIKSVVLIRGSGVPEFNRAVEERIRNWKLYLNKNGLRVSGTVELEIDFTLIKK